MGGIGDDFGKGIEEINFRGKGSGIYCVYSFDYFYFFCWNYY